MELQHYELWHQALCTEPIGEKKEWQHNILVHLGRTLDPAGFQAWWSEVKDFLEETPPLLAQVIENQEHFDAYGFWEPEVHDLNEAILHVNLDPPLKDLIPEIERLLKRLKAKPVGRPPARERFAEYSLSRTPNIQHIKKLFEVYNSRAEGKSLVDVALTHNLASQATPPEVGDHDYNIVMEKAASKYIKQADRLIRNAALGVFPEYYVDITPDDDYALVYRSKDGTAIDISTGKPWTEE